MGRSPRPRPKYLGRKLLIIRQRLGLSQSEMRDRLGLAIDHSAVSGYELGKREPPLPVLLCYARIARVSTDILIDDEAKLPSRLP
jgi:transcriptional regulator with XRE-family HTH domain